jgi:6-phosphogluconolactonase
MHRHSLIVLLLPMLSFALCAASPDYIAFIGTYTDAKSHSKGIYAYRFHPATGKLDSLGLVATTDNPTFLAIHPNHRFLYAVNETDNFRGQKTGAVSAYAIDAHDGKLKLLNQVSSRGSGPCHLAVDKTGHALTVANYNSGSVAAFPIHDDGSLGEASAFFQHKGTSVDKARQEGPHAHSTNISPDNRLVFVDDLGLDKVFVYRLTAATASLTPNDPPFAQVHPGSGPRHFVLHPNGKFAYVINEMGTTVTAFAYDNSRGALREIQNISTLPKDFKGVSDTAEIAMDAKGRFLYGSNRGHDSIAVFTVNPNTGLLTPLEHVPTGGKTPRNFAIDPTEAWLLAANQDSANIVVFRRNSATGRLTRSSEVTGIDAPVCIVFVPAE